jgi:hypothetical protein
VAEIYFESKTQNPKSKAALPHECAERLRLSVSSKKIMGQRPKFIQIVFQFHPETKHPDSGIYSIRIG